MKRNGCIKTGARVYFSNYGQTISADVFRVGNCIVVKTHPGQLEQYTGAVMSGTDVVISSQTSGNEFWRADLGVFIVPEDTVLFNTEM